MKADETRSLSAMGSSNVPRVVTWPRFRARYPSRRSVMDAKRKMAAARRTSYFVKRTVMRSGIKKIRLNVRPLGRFKRLILADGKGTRLRPLTINTPKPVVPVANSPFLLYQIDLMRSAGIDEIILSLSYQPRKIEDLLKDGSDYGVTIKYAVEGTPLGTGGAFKNAEEHISDATVVFNGDVLTDIDLAAVVAHHKERKAVATIVLTPVENPSAYGLVET